MVTYFEKKDVPDTKEIRSPFYFPGECFFKSLSCFSVVILISMFIALMAYVFLTLALKVDGFKLDAFLELFKCFCILFLAFFIFTCSSYLISKRKVSREQLNWMVMVHKDIDMPEPDKCMTRQDLVKYIMKLDKVTRNRKDELEASLADSMKDFIHKFGVELERERE